MSHRDPEIGLTSSDEEIIARAIHIARTPVARDPVAVNRALVAVRVPRRPLRLSLHPAFGVALLVLAFAAGAAFMRAFHGGTTAARSASARPVTFVLVADDARDVAIAGDFNDWQPERMRVQQRGGVWSVVIPLEPGRYSYAFVVDGERWLSDPAALPAAAEDFGRPSSIVVVEERTL